MRLVINTADRNLLNGSSGPHSKPPIRLSVIPNACLTGISSECHPEEVSSLGVAAQLVLYSKKQ